VHSLPVGIFIVWILILLCSVSYKMPFYEAKAVGIKSDGLKFEKFTIGRGIVGESTNILNGIWKKILGLNYRHYLG